MRKLGFIVSGFWIVLGIIAFGLNMNNQLTYLDFLTDVHSFAYFIPLGGAILYAVLLSFRSKVIKLVSTIGIIWCGVMFWTFVYIVTPKTTAIPNSSIVVKDSSFLFDGKLRFYEVKGFFIKPVFSCAYEEDHKVCRYNIVDDQIVIEYGVYGEPFKYEYIPITEAD